MEEKNQQFQQFHEYRREQRVTAFCDHVYSNVHNTWFGHLIWELVWHKSLRACNS